MIILNTISCEGVILCYDNDDDFINDLDYLFRDNDKNYIKDKDYLFQSGLADCPCAPPC